jgi:hypothetical protein
MGSGSDKCKSEILVEVDKAKAAGQVDKVECSPERKRWKSVGRRATLYIEETVPGEIRGALAAFVATAIGTMAGLLVNSGFGVRASIINFVYGLLGPLFDIARDYPNSQLVIAGFIYTVPVVLIVGLGIGLILRGIRFRRLLLCSILIWPLYIVGRRLMLFVRIGEQEGRAASALFQTFIVPEMVAYLLQYSLLFLIIYLTNAILVRPARSARVVQRSARW